MNTKVKVQAHNVIILDESGSMESIKRPIVSGFNELVQNIQQLEKENADQEHFITFVSFNSAGIKEIHFCAPANRLKMIDNTQYQPNGCTPLYDAIGFTLTKLQTALQGVPEYNVLVTIMTDGEENSSKEYSGQTIKQVIENLKQKGWTFTYIGTDHDVEKVAFSLSITNTLMFGKNEDEVREMFVKENYHRRKYHKDKSRPMQMQSAVCGDDYFNEDKSLYRFHKVHKQYFPTALQEIQQGAKRGHWMWFIFPQIAGLGHSDNAKYYAIRDLVEAQDFLQEQVGENLVRISEELLKLPETDAEKIFGQIDAIKLRSCMTLFSLVPDTNPVFQKVLDKFFGGQPDELTRQKIKA
jgi:uncharacterized protein (DUF1810 family)